VRNAQFINEVLLKRNKPPLLKGVKCSGGKGKGYSDNPMRRGGKNDSEQKRKLGVFLPEEGIWGERGCNLVRGKEDGGRIF